MTGSQAQPACVIQPNGGGGGFYRQAAVPELPVTRLRQLTQLIASISPPFRRRDLAGHRRPETPAT